jgi:hypothetical protein
MRANQKGAAACVHGLRTQPLVTSVLRPKSLANRIATSNDDKLNTDSCIAMALPDDLQTLGDSGEFTWMNSELTPDGANARGIGGTMCLLPMSNIGDFEIAESNGAEYS